MTVRTGCKTHTFRHHLVWKDVFVLEAQKQSELQAHRSLRTVVTLRERKVVRAPVIPHKVSCWQLNRRALSSAASAKVNFLGAETALLLRNGSQRWTDSPSVSFSRESFVRTEHAGTCMSFKAGSIFSFKLSPSGNHTERVAEDHFRVTHTEEWNQQRHEDQTCTVPETV